MLLTFSFPTQQWAHPRWCHRSRRFRTTYKTHFKSDQALHQSTTLLVCYPDLQLVILVAILVLRQIGWLAIHDMPSSELTDPNANDHPIGRGPKMKNSRIDK